MAKSSSPIEYSLVTSPKGYFNKREITNMEPNTLVAGSKNMIINDGDKVATRKGFTLDGDAGAVIGGIESSYDFISRNGKKILRAFDGASANTGKLQVRTEYVAGTPVYADLLTGLTYTDFCYTSWWYATEAVRVAIFVDGTTSIRMWGGGIAYVLSATANTITKSGTATWAQSGFFINLVGRTVSINGTTYTYTGGENTTTLTGVAALPALTAGQPVFQGVVTITSLTGVSPAITPNVVMTRDNQVIYGASLSATNPTPVIYGSKNTDYADCSFTTPIRVPGEGFKLTLDNYTVGFTQDDDSIYIFAGTDDIYRVTFILNSAQDGESIVIKKLRAGAGQSAISQKAIIPVKNGIMYFTNEKTLSWLTSVQNIFTPQSLPISDPIKNDFDSFDLTGATGVFFENEIWLAIPAENLVYRYDFDKTLWQTPQTIPISSFSIIKNETTQENELFGHSNSKNETYKLNDGLSDNGVIIEYVAAFAYRQFGNRAAYKQYDQYYNELYMSVSTNVTVSHRYEYLGSNLIIEKVINGSDTGLMFANPIDANLGKNNLGKDPLGSTASDNPIGSSGTEDDLYKYRCIHELKMVDFFENQIIFSSDSENAQFQLIAHGPNITMSSNLPTSYGR